MPNQNKQQKSHQKNENNLKQKVINDIILNDLIRISKWL